ncbi:MAG TPA: hypothetical protein VFW80_02855 [Gaiellaceae bacterium]|nr:hypothetical protein [Gaiellaceae bacterium]
MAADARTDFAPPRARLLAAVRVTPAQALALVFAASVIGRTLAAWLRATPIYFPDEYIYSELGRSFAEHGRPLVRGGSAHFPALLQPLLTAPAWLVGDVGVSYRLIQLETVTVMSLAAFVAYWFARRLGLSAWLSVAIGAFAVAIPDVLYSGWMLADPFAYPLALAAVGTAVVALSEPSRRAQAAFVGLAALATLARIQFVFLPALFVLAVLAMGLRERRVRRALAEQRLALLSFAAAILVLVAAGPSQLLGYYDVLLESDLSVWLTFKWFGSDAMLLLYSSGWVLVPGALLGIAHALWRPSSRAELAFAVCATPFSVTVLGQAAFYGASGADRIQERYFFYVLPLMALAFGLYARRGFPWWRLQALVFACLLVVSMRVPLSGFAAAQGKTNSAFLFAVGQAEALAGDVGLVSLLIALAALLLSLAAVAATRRRRNRPTLLVWVAIAAACLGSTASVGFEHAIAGNVREYLLWPNASFVDDADLGAVALLESQFADSSFTSEELFWNRSLESVLLLPNAPAPDAFAAKHLMIGRDGSLLEDGRPVVRPLLVDMYGATLELDGVERVGRNRFYQLLRPAGRPRLSVYAIGRYWDGWLQTVGRFRVWPTDSGRLAGTLRFTLSLPSDFTAASVTFTSPDGTRTVHVEPGTSSQVALPVCSPGPWSADYSGQVRFRSRGRLLTARSSRPVFTPDAGACQGDLDETPSGPPGV